MAEQWTGGLGRSAPPLDVGRAVMDLALPARRRAG